MSEASTVIAKVLDELQRFLAPLLHPAMSDGDRARVLAELGYGAGEYLDALTGFLTVGSAVNSLLDSATGLARPGATLEDGLRVALDAAEELAKLKAAADATAGLPPDMAPVVDDFLRVLVVNWLDFRQLPVYSALVLLDLISSVAPAPLAVVGSEVRELQGPPPAGAKLLRVGGGRGRIHVERLVDPAKLFTDPFGLGPDPLGDAAKTEATSDLLLPRLGALAHSLGVDAEYGLVEPGDTEVDRTLVLRAWLPGLGVHCAVGIELEPRTSTRSGAVVLYPLGSFAYEGAVGRWAYRLSTTINGQPLRFHDKGVEFVAPPPGVGGASFALEGEFRLGSEVGGAPAVVIGGAKGTRLELGSIGVRAGATVSPADQDYLLGLAIDRNRLVVAAGDGDSFLRTVLPPEGLEVAFDLSVLWTRKAGLRFDGAAGFDVTVPVKGERRPGVNIHAVRVAGALDAKHAELTVGLDVSVDLQILVATIERVGLRGRLDFGRRAGPGGGPSNLGVVHADLAFAPPRGIGLAVDAGGVKGGGFISLDPDAGRYSGVLGLRLPGDIGLDAVALLDTKRLPPDGGDGFSLLAMMNARLPAIQLGLGFTLNGIGGIVGIHRDLKLKELEKRIFSGGLDDVIFPEDPVKNAARILSAVDVVFPPARDRHTFGPVLMIGWGLGGAKTANLAEARLALLLSLPWPAKVALLGQLEVRLPSWAAPVVKLKLDAGGLLDFEAKLFSLFLNIYDSRIGAFDLEGSAAFRITWGDTPSFGMALGGFHPRFKPPPGFPVLKRMRLGLKYEDWFSLSFSAYLAVTTNTFQMGARVEAYAKLGWGFSILGYLGFDALITFDPFRFAFDFEAGLALKRHKQTLLGIELAGQIEGPGIWHVRATARFTFIFTFEVGVEFKTGKPLPASRLQAIDVWADRLEREVGDPRNWTARAPGSGLVDLVDADGLRVDPGATLEWTQRVVPFGETLEKLGAAPVVGGSTRFDLVGVSAPGVAGVGLTPVRGPFARGHFAELTRDEKLSLPSFEPMTAGARLGFDGVGAGGFSALSPQIETFRIQRAAEVPAPPALVRDGSGAVAAGQEAAVLDLALAAGQGKGFLGAVPVDARVRIRDDEYTAHGAGVPTGANALSSGSRFAAHRAAAAAGGAAAPAWELGG